MTSSTAAPARPRRPASRKQRLLRIVLLLTIGTVLGLTLAEVALRVLRAATRPALYQLDDRLGWRLAPSLDRTLADEHGRQLRFVTDDAGFRVAAERAAMAPDADAARVLFVGDSFTMGAQVRHEELFVTLLDAALGADVVCTNGGVGGWSTVQQLLALERWLPDVAPRLVVLVAYENDLVDNLMPYFSGLGPRPHARIDGDGTAAELVADPDPAPFERFLQPAPGALWLYEHCAIYQSVHKNVFLPGHGEELAKLEAHERDAVPESAQHAAMAWALARMRELVRRHDAELCVCLLPSREHAATDQPVPMHEWLAKTCLALDLPFVSLLDALRDDGGGDGYFPVDIHFNRAGHAAAARAMLPFVQAQLR